MKIKHIQTDIRRDIKMEKEKFNFQEYQNQYDKEHYFAFKVKLKKEEKKELDDLLDKLGMTKAEFLRNAIEELKKSQNK